MLDAYEKPWIHFFFSIQISSGKIVIEVFVSVIIIIIFKSKIEDSFIFITIFYASYIILLKNTRRFPFVH